MALYQRLDDWVIFGLKNENELIYQGIQHLRSCIATQTASTISHFDHFDISQLLKPFQFSRLIYIPSVLTSHQQYFNQQQFFVLFYETMNISNSVK